MTKGRWIATVLILALVGVATWQGLKPKPPPSAEEWSAAGRRRSSNPSLQSRHWAPQI